MAFKVSGPDPGARIAQAHRGTVRAVVALSALFAFDAAVLAGVAARFGPVVRLVDRAGGRAVIALGIALVSALAGGALALHAARRISRAGAEARRAVAVAEDALRHREEFLALAAHELKTPLTAALLEIGAATREATRRGDAAQLRLLGRSDRAMRRLAELVGRLVEISAEDEAVAAATPPPEPVDLADVARAALEERSELFRRAACDVRLEVRARPTGRWDRARLSRALASLLVNAAKYGHGRPVHVVVDADGDRARLAVRDHGIGVPPDRADRIFDRFERAVSSRHYGGLGLGLWLTRRDAHALGGTVRVESAAGPGAVFTLELPREGRARAPSA